MTPLVHDDFAHATREGLIPSIVRRAATATAPGEEPSGSYAGSLLVTLDTAHLSNVEQPTSFTEALRLYLEI
jgi:hypothetical protein